MMRHGLRVLSALCVTFVSVVATAGASVSQTQITTPGSPTYLTFTETNSTQTGTTTFPIAGTANSTATGTDKVDILCFYGDAGDHVTLATGVALSASGGFSTTGHIAGSGSGGLGDRACYLRAVPTGTVADSNAYAGPLLEQGEYDQSTITGTGTSNDGKLYDYYIRGQGLSAADDFDSAGSCGLDDSYLIDTSLGQTTTAFYCNAWFATSNAPSGGTRSDIQVDGNDAYMPNSVEDDLFSGADKLAGFPALTDSYSRDPSTGNITITETDPVVRCSPGGYPATSTNCTSLISTGVELSRTIVESDGGHSVTVTDNWQSTNGASHAIDLLYENDQYFGDSLQGEIGYEFPGQSAFAAHAAPDAVPLPSGPGTILVKNTAVADGDPLTGVGAIGYDVAPSQAIFISAAGTDPNNMNLHYTGTVPATGALTYHFVYSTDYSAAAVTSEYLRAEDAFATPTLTLSPVGSATTTKPTLTVTGTATDLDAVSGVTVNGSPVYVSPAGAFTSVVSLTPGANKLTVIATNAAGNTTTRTATVTYVTCVVPKLVGKKLSAARSALKAAHCAVGAITRKTVRQPTGKAGKHVSGKVLASSPRAGTKGPAGVKVKLTVSR